MIAAGEFPPTVGTKCHARRQFGPRTLARAQPRQKLHGRRRSWPACRRRLPWPVAIAPGHGAHHHHSFTIPIEDDELEPRGAYSYWECREGEPLAARVHGSTGDGCAKTNVAHSPAKIMREQMNATRLLPFLMPS
jgi:hypothetical protein